MASADKEQSPLPFSIPSAPQTSHMQRSFVHTFSYSWPQPKNSSTLRMSVVRV
jgi:hypothetical protein